MTNLETSLRHYAEFLDERSLDLLPDHTPPSDAGDFLNTTDGDVIIVDLLENANDSDADEPESTNRRASLLAAGAAIAVVFALAAAVLWPDSDSELDIIDGPTNPAVEPEAGEENASQDTEDSLSESTLEPLEVVERFYEGFEAADLNVLSELIADAALTSDQFGEYDKDALLKLEAFLIGQRARVLERECGIDSQLLDGTVIVCDYRVETAPSRSVDLATPVMRAMTVSEGQIVEIDQEVGSPDWVQSRRTFDIWLASRDGGVPEGARYGIFDSIDAALAGGRLAAQLVPEWEAFREATGCQPIDECDADIVIARSFTESRNIRAGAALAAMISDSANLSDLAANADEYVAVSEFERATDRTFEDIRCWRLSTLPSCTFSHSNAWSRALGLEDETARFEFAISDGKISEVSLFGAWPFHREAWEQFEAWLIDNHGDDVTTMLGADGRTPILTPESIALWEQYTAEFIAESSKG